MFIRDRCNDALEPTLPGHIDDDGTLHLSFGVSPLVTVGTRSDAEIETVRMFVYTANGNSVLQKEDIPVTGSGSEYTGQVILNSRVLDPDESPKFYFVANPVADDKIDGATTSVGNLLNAKFTDVKDASSRLVMSSKELTKDEALSTVALWHNGAKISVSNAVKDSSSEIGYSGGSTKYDFSTFVTTSKSPALAGGVGSGKTDDMPKENYLGSYNAAVQFSVLDTEDYAATKAEKYVHPTDNSSEGAEYKSFIIVKANYEGTDYFYRLDFKQKRVKSGTDPVQYEEYPIDILPNHHYQFLIKSVTGIGYRTASDAALHPFSMVDYEIHDHSPVIYNMISDGIRELGVQKRITNNDKDNAYETLYVKVFSSSDDADNEVGNLTKDCFTTTAGWLAVESVSVASSSELDENGNNVWGDSGTSTDPNHKGKIYAVKLKFDTNTSNPGTLTTDLTVTWQGLSRDVEIVWDRAFDTSKLFDPTVELKIFRGESESWDNSGLQEYYNSDYFGNFLEKESRATGEAASSGTTAIQNNGQARNVGLHFPMPYGDGSKWTYWYKVSLNSALASTFDWEVEAVGISNVTFSKTKGNHNDRVFYVHRSSSDEDFNYETGYLNIKITVGDETISYDNVKLYHTGFFHKDNGSSGGTNYLGGGSTLVTKWNYYEVVSAGGNHWLDRNMGATSAQMYIEGGMTDNPGAKGYYMNVANYSKWNNPTIFTNSVPPGYEVPSVSQWNKLKADSQFNLELNGAYYMPTLRVGSKLTYFPTSQYYEGTNLQGEARAGYYWTRDAATGTEKDEIGNWLKCMCFSGTASSYINGRTMGRGTTYYMSLRAVAKNNEDNSSHPGKFGFYVTGATHVYLYVQNADNTRTAATTWPGQAVGNYQTANKTFYYSYETTTADLSTIRVIFNYVDKEGIIHTYSDNDFDEVNHTHTNILPSQAQGWLVLGTSQSSGFTKDDCGVTISGTLSGGNSTNGTTWNVDSPVPDIPFTPSTFRILWPTGSNYKYIRIKDKNGNVLLNWAERTDEAYGYSYNGTNTWSWRQYTASASQLKFEFAATNSNPSTIYIPDPDKVYTNSDLQDLTGHSASGIIITKLKLATSEEPPVNNDFRILWPKDGSYNQIQIMDGGSIVSAYSNASNSNYPYGGSTYYAFDVTLTQSSVSFKFKNSSGTETTPNPNNAYTLANYTTEVDGRRIVKIDALVQQSSDTYRIWWKKATFTSQPYINIKKSDGSYSRQNHTGEENGYYYYDHNSSTVVFYFSDSNGNNKYQANGNKDWSFGSSDWSKDGNIYHHWIDDYQTGGTGKPTGGGNTETIYRVYWTKGDDHGRDRINYWSNDNSFWGKEYNQGHEYAPNTSKDYYYYDIKVSSDKNLTYLKANAYNNSTADSDEWKWYPKSNDTKDILTNSSDAPSGKSYHKYIILY
ncbi:MAG: hypothetical protein K2J48_10165 [Muribaculaceae bacterium]|nr:hypothetical protein [Muribaculaceae bacterium]